MLEKLTYEDELLIPKTIIKSHFIGNKSALFKKHEPCISFNIKSTFEFKKKGSFLLLDFGKEICGGIRIISNYTEGTAKFHIRFGESMTEAVSNLGVKNACNDHSPRDFEVYVPSLADLTFGQTGYRFCYIELVSNESITIQNIYGTNRLPQFENEAEIITDDEQLNQIIKTAIYTLKLCCQNNYIWDGIKRDRLVWSGDIHPEMLSCFYMFGDIPNIKNSLLFIKKDTNSKQWVNWIPSYSAWWIINLCDYVRLSGNKKILISNKKYIADILKKINSSIDYNSKMTMDGTNMPFFLDWPTYKTEDAVIGTAALFMLASKKYLSFFENEDAIEIITKLTPYLKDAEPSTKQAAAFRMLSLESAEDISEFFENGGSKEFSTFMAYYILKADAICGGKQMLSIIKEYYGAMLEKGATTFWEDFDVDWMENSNRIDCFPVEGQRDIHGDFGKFCYKNFRHSLCHGWSTGVLAFLIEYVIGLKIENGKVTEIKPNLMGLKTVVAKIPLGDKLLYIKIKDTQVESFLT